MSQWAPIKAALAPYYRIRRAFFGWFQRQLFLRWMLFGFLSGLFWIHVIVHSMHHVIAYMYAVYLLNLGARFLTPLNFEDICAAQAEANGGTILPSSQSLKADGGLDQGGDEGDDYEFKPFMRQLNEFTFWLCAIRSTYIVLACAQFEFLDLPVFWPLLLLYFVVLFLATMRQQVENMIKYKYIPFNFGKKTYGSITRQQK